MQIYLVGNIGSLQGVAAHIANCAKCQQPLKVQDRHVTKFYQRWGFELLRDPSPGGLEGDNIKINLQ